jgi:hypothetical protein
MRFWFIMPYSIMREHGSNTFIRNSGNNLCDYTVSWSRSPQFKYPPFWKPQGSVEDTDNQTFMCRRHEPMRSVGAVILLMDSINVSPKHQNRVFNKTAGKIYRRVHWTQDSTVGTDLTIYGRRTNWEHFLPQLPLQSRGRWDLKFRWQRRRQLRLQSMG